MQQEPNSVFPKLFNQTRPEGKSGDTCQTCWDGLERRKDVLSLAQEVYDRLDRQDHMMLKFHDDFLVHLAETKQTKDLVNELLELYKGSKFMVTVFKFFVPIVAAVAALFLWIKDHLK